MIFHGLTSHTNEGAYVAKELAKKGYEVVGF
jgi:alpha-beta hydrolase superfamily lysophospholipase